MNPSDGWQRIETLVEGAAAHVVRIDTGGRGLTGVALSPTHVATSSRALRREEGLVVTRGETSVAAEVVGRDVATDVAVLAVEPGRLGEPLQPPAWRAAASLRVGEPVVAVARPGESVRAALAILGVVGGPYAGVGGARIDRYVELDRELPRGFAGSLLVDGRGQAVGIHLPGVLRGAMVSLPSETLQRVAHQIAQHGQVQRGYLGVGVYPATLPGDVASGFGQDRGVAVVALEEGGPAQKAGLGVGDIILSIDGQTVRSPLSLRSLLLERTGQTLDLAVLRAGAAVHLQVPVGARP